MGRKKNKNVSKCFTITRPVNLGTEQAVKIAVATGRGVRYEYWLNPHRKVIVLIGGDTYLSRDFCIRGFAEGIRIEGSLTITDRFTQDGEGRRDFKLLTLKEIKEAKELRYYHNVLIYRFFGRCHSRGWWAGQIMQDFKKNVAPEDRYDVLLMLAWRAQFMPAGAKIYKR